MPCSASSSGVSFFAPRRRMLVAPLAKAREIELVPGGKPWRSVPCGAQPAGRLASSSREDHVGVAQAAVVGHGADAGQGAAQVLLQEPQRAADAGAGRALRIGAQAAEAGIEPDRGTDRPVDDHHRKGAARRGLQRLAPRLGIEEGLDGGHQHRQVLGPAARHRQRDGARLDRGDAAARRKGAEHFARAAGRRPAGSSPPAPGSGARGAGRRPSGWRASGDSRARSVLDARALHAQHRRLARAVAGKAERQRVRPS